MSQIIFINPNDIMKLTKDFIIPKKLDNKSFIIGIKYNDQILSYIYFTVFDDYIHINYSFTINKFRKLGHSTLLRKFLIEYANLNNKNKIISVPFENANSLSILLKLGFIKDINNDSFILYL